jgi:tripeptide aminopeptidase
MDEERLLQGFLELVKIDSLSLNEAEVAAWCRRELESIGCTVREDASASATGSNTGNLIVSLPARGAADAADTASDAASGAVGATGGAAGAVDATSDTASSAASGRLYFSAHMDTVTPGEGIEPVVADGIISSAGETILGGDDKAGLAAIIEAFRVLAAGDLPHPEVRALFSIGEEIGILGARHIDGADFDGEPCFVLDGDGKPGTVLVAAPFHDGFTATFNGRAAHAGVQPEAGISAIALAARAISAMQLGRLDERSTANVGSISGGSADNIVPECCTLTGEYRSLDEPRLNEIHEQLKSALEGAVVDNEATVEIEWEREYPGYNYEVSDSFVQLALRAAETCGLEGRTAYTGGGSDANILAATGLRAVVLGTGMSRIHSTSEYLAVADLKDLTRWLLAIVAEFQQVV